MTDATKEDLMSELTEEQELLVLELRHKELKLRVEEKNREKVTLTLTALAESARKRQQEAEKERLMLQEIARKRAERETSEKAEEERIAKQAHEDRQALEEMIQKEKAQREERLAKQEAVARARAKAEQLRRDLEKLEAEIARGVTVEAVQEKPTTLSDNPISRILGRSPAVTEVRQGLDSVEQNKLEMKKVQEAKQSSWVPVRKRQRFADSGSSFEIETYLRKELRINANPQRCDQLSADWNASDIMKAVQMVVEIAKVTPMGHDNLFYAIDATLENASHGGQ